MDFEESIFSSARICVLQALRCQRITLVSLQPQEVHILHWCITLVIFEVATLRPFLYQLACLGAIAYSRWFQGCSRACSHLSCSLARLLGLRVTSHKHCELALYQGPKHVFSGPANTISGTCRVFLRSGCGGGGLSNNASGWPLGWLSFCLLASCTVSEFQKYLPALKSWEPLH